VVFLNAGDLAARGLRDGDRVDIETLVDDGHERRVSNFTARAWEIPPGCAAAYYPEASGLVAASTFSSGTRTPLYKEMPVRVSPSRPEQAPRLPDAVA
jgi:anaerobic selenocysteine-containing dehydrogenase